MSPDPAVESGLLAMVDGVYIVLKHAKRYDTPRALWTAVLVAAVRHRSRMSCSVRIRLLPAPPSVQPVWLTPRLKPGFCLSHIAVGLNLATRRCYFAATDVPRNVEARQLCPMMT